MDVSFLYSYNEYKKLTLKLAIQLRVAEANFVLSTFIEFLYRKENLADAPPSSSNRECDFTKIYAA